MALKFFSFCIKRTLFPNLIYRCLKIQLCLQCDALLRNKHYIKFYYDVIIVHDVSRVPEYTLVMSSSKLWMEKSGYCRLRRSILRVINKLVVYNLFIFV